MKAKQILIATLAALIMASSANYVTATGDGEGVLYIYTDPEKTTPVTTDSNGRYYVEPSVEYYFTIQGITEYNIGSEITIWAYRIDTNENMIIQNVVIDSNLNAYFTWTIPSELMDEVIKIKYGTSLENNWYYAQTEIWVNSRVGTGILKAYTDSARTSLAPLAPSSKKRAFSMLTSLLR